MNTLPLLSIVIPTRNREKYCIFAIKYILSLESEDFELIIQDNSDAKILYDFAVNINDSRLVYNYVENRLNSLINMDYAISHAKGKYVTMIGDDDTVLSSIFELVQYADKFNYDAISQKNIVSYNWPSLLESSSKGMLFFKQFTFEKQFPNLEKNIELFLENGMIDYLSFNFPKVYHGIVRRELLDKIKIKTGHYFGGLSPDIYSAISLSFFVEKIVVVDYPFTIGGACESSTTAQNMRNGHRGELETAPHLYLRGDYTWEKRIPSFYSVETIWAESGMKSFIELQKEIYLNKFNYCNFILFSFWRGKGIRWLIVKKVFETKDGLFQKILLALNLMLVLLPFIKRKCDKNKKERVCDALSINDVKDIAEAASIINNQIPKVFPY